MAQSATALLMGRPSLNVRKVGIRLHVEDCVFIEEHFGKGQLASWARKSLSNDIARFKQELESNEVLGAPFDAIQVQIRRLMRAKEMIEAGDVSVLLQEALKVEVERLQRDLELSKKPLDT